MNRLLMMLSFLALATALSAADPPPAGLANQLFNEKPAFLVGVRVNRPTCDYREGDALTVQVTSEEDAYLYVLYQQSDGQVFQVFPNKFQPNNQVKARQSVRVPAETDLFRWVVGKPFGKEIIKVLATKEPVDVLSQPELLKGRFNPVNNKALKGIEVELGEDKPIRWAETDVEINTFANTQPREASKAKRYGVFFGVSKHHFNEYLVKANGVEASQDRNTSHRDAQKLAEAMRVGGRLDEIKLLTNEKATKANMQAAITEWLPSVSRPGDTVVIYFSGNTGQFPDENGDEADGQDEYLVPHDMLGPKEFQALTKLHKENKLNERDAAMFEQLVEQLGPSADAKLIEHFAVTDDQLARWFQRLDGRQVVFISDSCHSGGFSKEEANFKGLTPAAKPKTMPETHFDFMQGDAGRLKSLGQSEHAVFCAAHANELSAEYMTQEMNLFTYCLVNFMNRPNGSQKIEDGFKSCESEMKQYFELWNRTLETVGKTERLTASHPFLLNHCTQPVFLKP